MLELESLDPFLSKIRFLDALSLDFAWSIGLWLAHYDDKAAFHSHVQLGDTVMQNENMQCAHTCLLLQSSIGIWQNLDVLNSLKTSQGIKTRQEECLDVDLVIISTCSDIPGLNLRTTWSPGPRAVGKAMKYFLLYFGSIMICVCCQNTLKGWLPMNNPDLCKLLAIPYCLEEISTTNNAKTFADVLKGIKQRQTTTQWRRCDVIAGSDS